MNIVNRDTFIKLPEGTVFTEWVPDWFGTLKIKGQSITWPDQEGNDYVELELVDVDASSSDSRWDILDRAVTSGESVPMSFEESGRNGCFEDDQLYAVREMAVCHQNGALGGKSPGFAKR